MDWSVVGPNAIHGMGCHSTRFMDDLGDGMDLPGDQDDGLDYFRFYCDPEDFVLNQGVMPFSDISENRKRDGTIKKIDNLGFLRIKSRLV